MAGKGRPSKETALLKKQGTYRNDRHGERIAIQKELSEEPADWLNEEEKEVWNKWYPVLQKNGMLKETDDVAFGLLCKTFYRVKSLSDSFRSVDDFVYDHTSDAGATVPRVEPKYTILVEAERNLLKLLTEFGLTPVARNKVKSILKDEKSPLDKLRNLQ